MVDEGALCLLSDANHTRAHFVPDMEAQQVRADQPLVIQVAGTECLSASCDVDRKASCEARLEGATIVVSSRLEWKSGDMSVCTSDCGSLAATCATPPLPAGTYTVQFGSMPDRSIVIPSTLTPACTGLRN